MSVLGNALARYLSGLTGLHSVELPESLTDEMAVLVRVANDGYRNRALLVTDDPSLPPDVATTSWRDVLGWRTTDDRIFAWKRGIREPDTSFRSVVRPFISSRFPGKGGGECTLELFVRICIAELWHRRHRAPTGDTFEAFHNTSIWVMRVLRHTFEGMGSTPALHWSDRLLDHWAGMLSTLDLGLATLGVAPDPRHAWEVVRVSGLPLPSQLGQGNLLLNAPKELDEKDWPRIAELWEDIVQSFIIPEGGIAVLMTALDYQMISATKTNPWRSLNWKLAEAFPSGTPAPVIGKAVFTAPPSPTLLSTVTPQHPIAPVPSWWGVSSDDLDRARKQLREPTSLLPDDTCTGIFRLLHNNLSVYVLNTRSGTVTYSHTPKKWRARITVGDIRLHFKEDWKALHVTVLEPQAAADGDAWINPDSLEIITRGATEDTPSRGIGKTYGDQLLITLGLVVEFSTAQNTQAGTLRGSWNPNRTLRVKLHVQRRIDGEWDRGRNVETEIDLLIPSPFSPTVAVSTGGKLVAVAPDGQDKYEANAAFSGLWVPDTTPTVLLKEEGFYSVHLYDGTLMPYTQSFAVIAQPNIDGAAFGPPTGALFQPQQRELDDGVLVSNSIPGGIEDIAVFKVKERSTNLSSGLLSAARGQPAGRKQPSATARNGVLGRYQTHVTEALCGVANATPNSLYQYVVSSSDTPLNWPSHPGTPAPLLLLAAAQGFVLPGIGNGPSAQLVQSPEWQAFMKAIQSVCHALGLVAGAEDVWLTGLDFSNVSASTVKSYVDAHRNLLRAAKLSLQPADIFWASYPFSVLVVDGRPGVGLGHLLAVLLSPLHPIRFSWTYAVTVIAKNNAGDSSLLQLAEGWNVPCTGISVNPADQQMQLVAVPTDPGADQDFVSWSALATLGSSGLAELPVFAAGQPLPWGGRTGINARVVERAVRDYLLVHPHINSIEVDIRSVSPAPRAQEIDDAVLGVLGAAGGGEMKELGGGARVWDSEYRHGALPTRDRLSAIRGDSHESRPFEWRIYPVDAPPVDTDIAMVENASVHLAIVKGEVNGVLGLLPLRRFAPSVLNGLKLDQHFTPAANEDILGLADLLREIEGNDKHAEYSALRATPQVQALGIGQGSRWEVLGTFNLDPTLLSAVVTSAPQTGETRLLWEWRPSWMPVDRKTADLARRPYYVIARIPASLLKALQARQGLTPLQAEELLRVLGHRGIGLAALSAGSGTQESAAAGFFYAMQLLLPPSSAPRAEIPGLGANTILGVIPLDPIEPLLQGLAGKKLERRADLLAVIISISESNNVKLCFVPLEVKHHGMPAQPEPIPEATNRELKRAREQLAQTADLLTSIAASLTCIANPADSAGLYLKRLALTTLIDLALSFTPRACPISVRSEILHRVFSGSLAIGVGDPVLLWFAPGSVVLSGGPCVVDPYGATTIDSVRIREMFFDPASVPGLWWPGMETSANELLVRNQVNDVIGTAFSSCAANGYQAASDLRMSLRELLSLPANDQDQMGPEGDRPALPQSPSSLSDPAVPAPAEGTGETSSSLSATSEHEVSDSETLQIATPVEVPLVLRGDESTSAGVEPEEKTLQSMEDSESQGSLFPPTLSPRAVIGWSSLQSRWTIIGKLSVSEDAVAFDLDHPKTVGIFGYMGSGKSYLLGNIIESAVQPITGINSLPVPLAVVVFNYRRNAADRFELSSLGLPNPSSVDAEKLAQEYGAFPQGLQNLHVLCLPGELRPERLQEYGPIGSTELYFNPRSLGAEDWELLMGEPGSEAVFARTIRNALVDLRSAGDITLENLENMVLTRLTGGSRTAAKLRFDFVRRYFSEEHGIDFGELLQPGRVLIIDLRQPLFNKEDALRFFLVCANQISKVQGRFNKMLVFDEAHEYMTNAFAERMEARIRLMRHEGTSYVFATQDVASIPVEISRFLTTRFVFDLGTRENIQDLEQVAPEFRGYQLLGVKPGYCFVQANTSANGMFSRPREVQVRPRVTQHGGATQIFSVDRNPKD